jgi:hypothetical protein
MAVKLTAKVLPYSRTIGGGLMLFDEGGRPVCQISLVARSAITEEQLVALARQLDRYIHQNGLELP